MLLVPPGHRRHTYTFAQYNPHSTPIPDGITIYCPLMHTHYKALSDQVHDMIHKARHEQLRTIVYVIALGRNAVPYGAYINELD